MTLKQWCIKVKRSTGRIIFQNDQTPHWIKIFSMMLQLISLLIIINLKLKQYEILFSQIFEMLFKSDQYMNSIIVILVFTLIINLVFRVSFFKCYYILIIHISFKQPLLRKILIYIILSLGLLLQILFTTQNSFYTRNILAQKNNSLKIIHFLGNILIVFLRYFVTNETIFSICVFSIYFFILILRIMSKMNHMYVKRFLEINYLFLLFCGIWNLFIRQFNLVVPTQQFLVLVLGSVIITYKIKNWIYSEELRAEKIQTDKKLIETIREMIIYLYSNKYSLKTRNVIEKFIELNNVELRLPKRFKLDIDSDELFLQRLSEIGNSYMENDNFDHMLLKAEIQFKINKNYYNAMKIIRIIERRLSIKDILNKILIYKLKNEIDQQITYLYNIHEVGTYEIILETDSFIDKLYEGALKYKKLWMLITESQVIVQNIQNLMISVLEFNSKIEQSYRNMKLKNKHSILLYFNYAFMVERKNSKAIKLFNEREFFIQNIHCDDQFNLVTQISLENDTLGEIEKISPNVEGKLGYQPRELENQNLKILIPEFFKKVHQTKFQDLLNKSDLGNIFESFQKNTLCENSEKQLYEVQVNFRMFYNREVDKLTALGYIKILENTSNFFIIFLKDSGNIVYMPESSHHKVNIMQYCKTQYQEFLKTLELNNQIELKITDYGDIKQQKDMTFILFKKFTNKSNIIILKQKQRIDISRMLYGVRDKKEGFNKYKIDKSSSISTFFAEKKKIHKESINNRTLVIRIVVIIVFTLIILTIMIYFLSLNSLKTEKKLELVSLGQFFYLGEINIYRLFIWNYYLYLNSKQGINFEFLDYSQNSIKQFLPVLLVNNYNLNMLGQSTVVQNTISGKQYTIKVYDLIQSIQSSMSFINTNYNTNKSFVLNMIKQQQQYIFQNEEAVMNTCMPSWVSQYNNLNEQIKGNYDILFLFCTTAQCVFTLVLSIFIIIFQRQQTKKYSEVITLITDIKNQDRFHFTETIRLFIEKITWCNNPHDFYQQIIKNSHYKKKNQRDSSNIQKMDSLISHNSLIGSPNSETSRIGYETNTTNRLFFRSSIIATPRVQVNKSISNALDDIIYKPQKALVKVKPIKIILLIKILIGILSIILVSIFNYLYTRSPDYLTSSYIENIFIEKDKAILYQQKIQYFLRAVQSNFTELDDFYEIYARESQFNEKGQNFKISLTQFPEFDQFNRIYNQMQYQPMCTYMDCTLYASQLNNTIQTIQLFNSGYIQELLNQTSTYPNSSSIFQDPEVIFTIYTQELFAKLQLKLFDLYFKCLKVYTSKIQKNVDRYLYILIGLTGAYFLLITVPEIWNLARKKKMIAEFLDIIDQDIYKDI